jgi:LPS export ABC transporter permease LptG
VDEAEATTLRRNARLDAGAASAAAPAELEPPRRHRLGRTIRRYTVRQLAQAFVVIVAVFAVAVLAAELVDYSDLVINRGFGASEVGTIALHRMVPVLARTLPFALLVAALTAVGRMGADRALLALEASGIPALRLSRPIVSFSLVVALVALAISWEVTPRMNRALNAAIGEAAARNPGGSLRGGFVASFGDWRIEAREVSSDGEHLRGVTAYAPPLGETLFARRGRFEEQVGGHARIVLEDGVFLMPVQGQLSQVRFEELDQEIDLDAGSVHVVDPISAASAAELFESMRAGASARERREAAAELHSRVAFPLSSALFGWIAVPLLLARGARVSRAGGAALGLATTIAYYGLVQAGYGLVRSESVPVAAAVWLPNALLAVCAGWLTLRVRRGLLRESLRTRLAIRRGHDRVSAAPRSHRRILDRYVFSRFVELTLLCFAALLLAYLLIDVMDNLKWFTRYGSTPSEILRYYGARMPLLFSRVLPLALVAASALTTSLFVASGELLGMRACGISAARTVTPIVAACVLLAAFYHVLANEWTPHASALASRIKNFEIKNRSASRHSVWQQADDSLYEIEWFDPLAGVAEGVTFYELAPDGLPLSRTDALRARHIGNGVWQLGESLRTVISPTSIERVKAQAYATLGDDVPAEADSGDLPLRDLRREIRNAERDGYDATPLRVEAHLRRASPLACVVLPALALVFATIGPPFATLGQMILVSFALALSHGLLTAVGASLGNGGALPPVLAGWAPIGLVAFGGALMGWRARASERRR